MWATGNEQTKVRRRVAILRPREQTLHRVQQRLEPLQSVVHRGDEGDGRARRQIPALAPLRAAARTIVLRKPVRVDGAADDAHGVFWDAEVLPEVLTNHEAVDNN